MGFLRHLFSLLATMAISRAEAWPGLFQPATIVHAVDQAREISRRHLSGGANFNQVCDSFAKNFGSMSKSHCECNGRHSSVFCKMPETCERVEGCDRKICTSLVAQVLLKRQDDSYAVSSIDLVADYRGSAYEGERAFLDDKNTCRQWFVIEGLEYECNSCTLCDEGGVDLDCSNIQASAVNHGCMYTSSSFSFLDYCPKEGAPEPESPGYPVSSSPSGIDSRSTSVKMPDSMVMKTGVLAMVLALAF